MKVVASVIVVFIFSLLCLGMKVYAQPMSGYTYEIMIETADKALENKDYYNALDWFEQAYLEQRTDEVAYTIAHLHMLLRDYGRAENWFGRLVRSRKGKVDYPEARFYQARMMKQGGKYDAAKEAFQDYLANTDNDSLATIARLELDGILKLNEFRPLRPVEVTPIEEINFKHSDASPYLYNRAELYFTSFAADSIIVLDDDDVDFEAKIYKSQWDEEKGWQKGEPLGLHINRIGYHTANPTFSINRQRMYFTRTILTGNEIEESTIYVSRKEGNEWGPAVEVNGGINGDFLSTHPSIGELYGREVLFFASNKDGGEGGFDLYYATVLSDDTVDEPVNLSAKINTRFNEITPFYRDGYLYFSTNGRPGFGGYDLFYIIWDGTQWSEPVNMGPGFNSPADDMYLYIDETQENGFLVSNREGGKFIKSKTCCDDIYAVAPAKIPVNLVATIGERRGGLRGGTIRILELLGESETQIVNEKNNDSNKFDISLERDKSYIIIAEHPRYFPDTIRINTVGVDQARTYERKFLLEIKPVEEVEIEYVTINEPVRLNNIYYDFDDDKILPSAEADLNLLFELLEQYPTMKIELSSHTDSRGSDSYNMRLSQRRADSAKKYLVAKGASTDRIKAVGYGETQILNDCVNDVECDEEDHQYNRRTEFKILEGPEVIELKKQITKEEAERRAAEQQKREDAELLKRRQQEQQKQRREEAKGKPAIQFNTNTANLGRMRQGDKKAHTFTFTNTGTADLLIEMVSACECTTVEWPTQAIKPGQRGQIKMVFDSTDEPGAINKTLDVIANTEPPVTQLTYKANVTERK